MSSVISWPADANELRPPSRPPAGKLALVVSGEDRVENRLLRAPSGLHVFMLDGWTAGLCIWFITAGWLR